MLTITIKLIDNKFCLEYSHDLQEMLKQHQDWCNELNDHIEEHGIEACGWLLGYSLLRRAEEVGGISCSINHLYGQQNGN
jgi:hypothetical protein